MENKAIVIDERRREKLYSGESTGAAFPAGGGKNRPAHLPGGFGAAGDRRPGASGIRMCAMGDKSKKDKDKGQKQNVAKQKQKEEIKSQKHPKKTS